MNTTTLTTAIISVIAISSASAATVYSKEGTTLDLGGRVEGRFNISEQNKTGEKGSFKDISRARVSLVGESKVTEQLSGFGKYEAEFTEEDSLTNRYFFAGLKGNFGVVSYGKQDAAQVQLTDFTDKLATFGAKAADIVNGNKDKRENALVYKGRFYSFTLSGDYIFADQDNNDNTNSVGVSGIYDLGQFRAGAGYVNQKQGDETENQINLVGDVKIDSLTFAALYTEGRLASGSLLHDHVGYELMAKYDIEKITLVGALNFQKNDTTKTDIVDEVAIEAVYLFNGHIRSYAGYRINQINDAKNELQLGVKYDF